MTKHPIEFQLADGSPVYIEVETLAGEGPQRVSRSGESTPEKAQASFNEVIARQRPGTGPPDSRGRGVERRLQSRRPAVGHRQCG